MIKYILLIHAARKHLVGKKIIRFMMSFYVFIVKVLILQRTYKSGVVHELWKGLVVWRTWVACITGSPKNVSPNPHTLISELKKRIKKEKEDDEKK